MTLEDRLAAFRALDRTSPANRWQRASLDPAEARRRRAERVGLAKELHAAGWPATRISTELGMTSTWWGARMRALGLEPLQPDQRAPMARRRARRAPAAESRLVGLVRERPGITTIAAREVLGVSRQRVFQMARVAIEAGYLRKTEPRPNRLYPVEVSMKVEQLAEEIAQKLSRWSFGSVSEEVFQRAVHEALKQDGFEVHGIEREWQLSRSDRPDFAVGQPGAPRVAIECKIKGTQADALRQLHRYAQHEEVGAIVLVTTRARHVMPAEVSGKRVHVVHVPGGIR